MENEIVKLENINPVVLYMEEGMSKVLKKITDEVESHAPDVATAKGRNEIASLAHRVSRSKVVLDNLGKELVSEWKVKAKKVDEVRKSTRDFLDELKDKARKPLTDWEIEEEARVKAEELAEEIERAFNEAVAENDFYDKKKALLEKEAEFNRREAERVAREEAEKVEKERVERVRIQEEEAKRLEEKRAKEEVARIQEAKEKAIKEEREKAEKEKQESINRERAAEERAKQAERDRIAAEERAKIEKEIAIKEEQRKAKEVADKKESDRIAEKKRIEEEEEKRIRNQSHRKKIQTEAIECFSDNKIEDALNIVKLISDGKIKNITINY